MSGPRSDAWGLNTHRDVVGQSTSPDGYAAFLYRDSTDGPMVNLNELLVDPTSGSHLTAATGINDDGAIIGYGHVNFGKDRAFLLTPVEVSDPPPQFDEAAIDPLAMILSNEVYVKLKLPNPPPYFIRARVRDLVRGMSASEKRAAIANVRIFETYLKVLGEELSRRVG